jgi:hypothetical protein
VEANQNSCTWHYIHLKKWKNVVLLLNKFSGTYYQGKCGKGGINTTYPCSITHLWRQWDWLRLVGLESIHSNVLYKAQNPFIKYSSYICEWVFCRNLCKQQVFFFLTCIDHTKENVIEYCEGSKIHFFPSSFGLWTYLWLDDKTSNDKDNEQVQIKKMCVIGIGGLMTMNHEKKNSKL